MIGKTIRYVVLIVLTVVVIFPLIWLISTSIKNQVDIFSTTPILIPKNITGSSYTNLVHNGLFYYLRNSAIVAVATSIVSIIIGTLAAYSLARFRLPGKWSPRISFWVLSTRMFPPIVTIIPLFQMLRVIGLVNTKTGLIIAYTAFNLPFVVWMMRGFFAEIPKDIEEMAMVEGTTRMGAFLRTSLPLSVPGLAATAIFTLILSWNEFLFALIITQTTRSQTLPILVASRIGQYQILWGQMSASGVLAMAPVLAFAFAVQRYLVRGMSFGAVKG